MMNDDAQQNIDYVWILGEVTVLLISFAFKKQDGLFSIFHLRI